MVTVLGMGIIKTTLKMMKLIKMLQWPIMMMMMTTTMMMMMMMMVMVIVMMT